MRYERQILLHIPTRLMRWTKASTQVDDQRFEHNEIWHDVIDRRTGNRVDNGFIKRNRALVKYLPAAPGRD